VIGLLVTLLGEILDFKFPELFYYSVEFLPAWLLRASSSHYSNLSITSVLIARYLGCQIIYMRKRYSYREHLVDPRGADPRADMQLLDLEISKLRSTLVQLRIADSDKMKIFAQIK
jgi:hypothetical protein